MPYTFDLSVANLLIRVDRSDPACLRLDWVGRCDNDSPKEVIAPFFAQVLAEAKEGRRSCEMHFEALQYFNSAVISTLIHLIKAAHAAGVALRIHYDGALGWQAVSFDVIRRALGSFEEGENRPGAEFVAAHGKDRQ